MIEVEFPDGSVRQVPSITKTIESGEVGPHAQYIFIEEPAYDPDWRFLGGTGGKWFAKPRR